MFDHNSVAISQINRQIFGYFLPKAESVTFNLSGLIEKKKNFHTHAPKPFPKYQFGIGSFHHSICHRPIPMWRQRHHIQVLGQKKLNAPLGETVGHGQAQFTNLVPIILLNYIFDYYLLTPVLDDVQV